jgi:hypothetical protein
MIRGNMSVFCWFAALSPTCQCTLATTLSMVFRPSSGGVAELVTSGPCLNSDWCAIDWGHAEMRLVTITHSDGPVSLMSGAGRGLPRPAVATETRLWTGVFWVSCS